MGTSAVSDYSPCAVRAVRRPETAHRSASPVTDLAAVGLLIALGGTFLEAGKLDHADRVLQRALLTIEAGGYASDCDIATLHNRLAHLERARGHEIDVP